MARTAKILNIRGREEYEEGLKLLRRVSQGEMEGGIPKFKDTAERLLSFHSQLADNGRRQLKVWLGSGRCKTTEEALLLLEQRVQGERSK